MKKLFTIVFGFLCAISSLTADTVVSENKPFSLTYNGNDWPFMRHELKNSGEFFDFFTNDFNEPFGIASIVAKDRTGETLQDCADNILELKDFPGSHISILKQEMRTINNIDMLFLDIKIQRDSLAVKGNCYIYLAKDYYVEISTYALEEYYKDFEIKLAQFINGFCVEAEEEV
ncbi:MAG: hypothetical protein JHC93_05315 [Parachlamydiales bacterium]|nr:hypothetical protein [Parachlamydiales bacterium]